MKLKSIPYIIISLLIESFCLAVGTGEMENLDSAKEIKISMPSIVWGGATSQESTKQLQKEFKQSIFVETNPNLGSFLTKVELPLPPNLVGRGTLGINYDSQYTENKGMGIGWRWNLPFITVHSTFTKHSVFSYSGPLGHFELIRTDEGTLAPSQLIKKLSGWSAEFETYRPAVDETGALFIRLGTMGWLALSLSGERWLFSNSGLPIKCINAKKQYLAFEWKEGILVGISDPIGNWSAQLTYSEDRQIMPYFLDGNWVTLPKSLKSMTISTDSKESRAIDFSYSEEYLTKVQIRGGVRSLFEAEYRNYSPKIIGRTSNGLVKDDKKILIDTNGPQAEAITPEEGMIYVDLNGDQKTDRIVLHVKELNDFIEHWVKQNSVAIKTEILKNNGENWNETKLKEFVRRYIIQKLSGQDIHVHVELAIADTPEGRTEFRRDDSIDLEDQVKKSGIRIIQLGECGEKLCFEPKSAFRFVDINKDGLKDIIITPVASRGEESKHIFNHWLYSLVATKSANTPSFQNLTTGPPRILILERDDDKIQARWNELKNTSTPLAQVNSLLGFHKLIMLADAGDLSINEETPFIELGAGRIGCFGGASFYIISGFDRETKRLRVSKQDLVTSHLIDNLLIPKDGVDLLNSDHVATLVRFGDLRKWQVVSARDIEQRLGSSNFKIVQDRETIEVQPGSSVQMMTKVKSAYGGSHNVAYKLHSGIWVVDEVQKDTIGAINTIESYDYQTLGVDPFRGTWIGFSKVTIAQRSSSELVAPKLIEKKYYKDVAPEVILYGSRSRLNGRLGQEQLKSTDGRLIEVKTFHAPLVLLTRDSRIVLMPQTFDQRKYLKDGKTYRQRDLRAFRVTEWIRNERNEDVFPLSVIHERIGAGLRSEVSDSLVDGHETIKVVGAFYPQEYKKVVLHHEHTDKSEVKASPTKTFFYDPETAELTKSCEENRCINYSFDTLGRPTGLAYTNGNWIKASYSGSSPIATSVEDADDTKQITSSALTGRPLIIKNSKGVVLSYKYTIDDITQEVIRVANGKNTVLFAAKGLTSESLTKRSLAIRNFDHDEVWYFDGFGSVIERLILKNQKWFSFGREEFFEDRLIRKWGASDWSSPQDLTFKVNIDERGLALNEWTRSDGNATFESDGGCTVKVLNGEYQTEQCQTSFGNISLQRIGDEEVLLETLLDGTVMKISTHGINYEYNNFQDVIGVAAPMAANNGWVSKRRTIDPEGRVEQTHDRFEVRRDPKGRVTNTLSIGSQLSQVEEENTLNRGLLIERALLVGKKPFRNIKISYDSLDDVIARHETVFNESLVKTYKRDDYGRIREEKIVTKYGTFKTESSYEQGELKQVMPYVKSIDRDPNGNITKIVYVSGLIVDREFVPFSNRMVSLSAKIDSKILYRETYAYNNIGQVVSRKIEDTVPEALSVRNDESFEYNKQNYQLATGLVPVNIGRNSAGNMISINDKRELFYTGDSLSSAGQSLNYYDYNGQLQMSCRYRFGQDTKPNINCFVKLSADEFMLNGYYGRRVVVDGLAVGFWLNGTFYPIISDHLGSIKALLTPNGKSLVLTREFGPWGTKKTHYVLDENSFHDLDKFLVWTFAGLISNPIYEMTRKQDDFELYWSETRIYSPQAREWLSIDSKLLWHPEELSDKPGNWHPTRYASNDPINKVDIMGKDSYQSNRKIGGDEATAWSASKVSPTHTFTFSTDMNDLGQEFVTDSYSWGNDGFSWHYNSAEDLRAAAQALKMGFANKIGNSEYDLNLRNTFFDKVTLQEHHIWTPWNNCKHEADRLKVMADLNSVNTNEWIREAISYNRKGHQIYEK